MGGWSSAGLSSEGERIGMEYVAILMRVLDDLDTNGLTNLALLHAFDACETAVRARGVSDPELASLVSIAGDFLTISIHAMSQTGDYAKSLRKRVNELLIICSAEMYHPIYQPA